MQVGWVPGFAPTGLVSIEPHWVFTDISFVRLQTLSVRAGFNIWDVKVAALSYVTYKTSKVYST